MDATEEILGYRITRKSADECIGRILAGIQAGNTGRYFVCSNPHSLEVARTDATFQKAIQEADLIVPDGVGMVIASRLLGGGIRRRITGTDIFMGLHRELNRLGGYSVFFLGSSEDNLARIETKMKAEFPNIRVAGTYSPPFKPEFTESDNRRMVEAVNHARPDVLWVGMTAPKQEKWVYRHRDQLKAKFIGPVGAVFDFFTERVKRSHPVFQQIGLEWLPRLLRQPNRLYERTLVSAPLFLSTVIKQSLLRKRAKADHDAALNKPPAGSKMKPPQNTSPSKCK